MVSFQHTGDPDPEVRDAAYAALGSAMKAVGEKPMLSFLSDIVEDKLKMAKVGAPLLVVSQFAITYFVFVIHSW